MLNPAIHFSAPSAQTTQQFNVGDFVLKQVATKYAGSAYYVASITPDSSAATSCSNGVGKVGRSFIGLSEVIPDGNGGTTTETTYYAHDPRLRLVENTPESPADPASYTEGLTCPAAPMSFLNSDSCTRRTSGVCAPLKFVDGTLVTLNYDTLRAWYTTCQKYVYIMTR